MLHTHLHTHTQSKREMTNKGSPYNSSHSSVLAVLVLLLVVVVAMAAMTKNVVSGSTLNGARCNGSIAECHGEEEELLMVIGESENGLKRHLLAFISNNALLKNRPVYNKPPGLPYLGRGCMAYNRCRA
ncbi:hypothetical protein QJS10_CPB15g01395 [Acorus calamus]|uniref:Uncharacterized protein n=1 Tax=Acorus calamus TaxID=4465 RepID=A0AAV9DBH9_ACOCL|nr:hypothetical protein QJS10_CPB15g01395 [Acorus calamus]